MTNGAGRSAPPAEADRESTWPALREDVAAPRSSPNPTVRPPAPEISFGSTTTDVAQPEPPAPQAIPEIAPEVLREEVSFPPVDVDHIDHRFFDADGHVGDGSDVDVRDPRAALKRSPAMVVRRAHLAKYVTATMGVALVLCVAAVVKTALTTGEASGDSAARAESPSQGASTLTAPVNAAPTTAQAPSPPAAAGLPAAAENAAGQGAQGQAAPLDNAPAPPAPTDNLVAAAAAVPPAEPPAAVDPPRPSEPTAAAAPAEAPAPAAQPQPAANPAPPQVQPAAPAPPASQAVAAIAPTTAAAGTATGAGATAVPAAAIPASASAAREKEHSRSALERSSLAESIGAGERSVALDASDAEAWLILGAAYQAKGDSRNAARCFKSCTDRSTHGPRGECAAMLH
jgi:hypothetical protein